MKRVATGLCAMFMIASCMPDCGDEVLSEAPSPSGKYIATVFERDCGATTDYASIVSVRDSSADFDGDDEESYVFTIDGRYKIDIQWDDERELVVTGLKASEDIVVQLEVWRDVKIRYTSE